MAPVIVLPLLAGAAAGGYWTWQRETRTLYYRSPNPTIRPPEQSSRQYEDEVVTRRKRWRLAKSLLSAAVGAAVAGVAFVMVSAGLSRH